MLLEATPFDSPTTRREMVEKALQTWDRQVLAQAAVYASQLFGWHERQTLLVLHNLLHWLKEHGYRWGALPQNVLLLFWEEVTTRRPPLSQRPLKQDFTLYAWWRGLRRVLDVIQWAGLRLPQLEMPPKPSYALVRPYLEESEFVQLLEGARQHPDGRLRRLGVAVLYLLGEAGVWPQELFTLRLEDFDPTGPGLRVRGQKARTVPLSKEAARALTAYLEDREAVVMLAPLPSPYLFVRMTNKKGGLGKPFNLNSLRALLERAAEIAGVFPERMVGSLRWRAVRRYLHQGVSPAEVATRMGLSSVAQLAREQTTG